MIGLAGIAILMLLMFFLEIPVGLAMGVVGVGGLWFLVSPEAAFNLLGTEIWTTFSQYGLSVIPLFVWMGQICFYSGVNENLYNTAYTWMGRVRGGLDAFGDLRKGGPLPYPLRRDTPPQRGAIYLEG